MKRLLVKYGSLLAAFALAISTYSAVFCFFMFHQPKIPESVAKLKKQ